ncbi:MAG: hypothetical protein JNL67_19685 [Planctomycetaceae bacterium]|nr:hypothetical protein [Planctomycetaceae bacterium]
MKHAHQKLQPTWEMSTQWVLKSISGAASATSDKNANESGDGEWLCLAQSELLSEEIERGLAQLEVEHESYVTTNSRRSQLRSGRNSA